MTTTVTIHTQLGDIEVEVDTERAPGTAANFLRYVDGGFYDGGQFHRTVTMDNQPDNLIRIEVIQAGINADREGERFPPIPLERTNVTGLRHTDSVISMARREPDSALSVIIEGLDAATLQSLTAYPYLIDALHAQAA